MEYVSDCDTNFNWSTWRKWRSKKEPSLSRRQQCENQLIDLKEYCNWEETCCHLVFDEKPPFKTNVKNSYAKKRMILTVHFNLNPNLPLHLHLTLVMKKIKGSETCSNIKQQT